MVWILCTAICLIAVVSAPASTNMTPQDRALLQSVIDYDRKTAVSDKYLSARDSGTLAWGESYILEMFCDMYGLTGDTHWLDRLTKHVDAILRNVSKDSRGRTGWFTRDFSLALADASADPANHGAAQLSPSQLVQRNQDRIVKVLGQAYTITAREDGGFDVRDKTTGVVTTLPKGTSDIVVSEFSFRLSGAAKPGDSFTVTTTAPESTDYVVHDGLICGPMARFAEIVHKDSKLKARYGDAAARYLKFIEETIVPKWDERWRDYERGGGAYLATNLRTHRFPNVILPHNQYLALGRVFLPLYRVTGNKTYLDKATRMAKFFASKLTLVDGGYVWNYWDSALPTDEPGAAMCRAEDASHASIDIQFAVDAYETGVVFTKRDIARFATTYADQMWNQSAEKPLYSFRVDRRTDPKGENDRLAVGGWQMLARYSAKVRRAIEPVYQHSHPGGPVAAEWLSARYAKP